ncbi:MAG TPA: hypothetical protein V6C81_17585 [Planktothrix sp.]|jgi:tetratricopeptide (TPR) repeat protein
MRKNRIAAISLACSLCPAFAITAALSDTKSHYHKYPEHLRRDFGDFDAPRSQPMTMFYDRSVFETSKDSPRLQSKEAFRAGLQYDAAGNFNKAILSYQNAITLSDYDPAVHWYLATAYQAQGKTAEAKREFARETAMKGLLLAEPEFNEPAVRTQSHAEAEHSVSRNSPAGDFGSNAQRFKPGEGLVPFDKDPVAPKPAPEQP